MGATKPRRYRLGSLRWSEDALKRAFFADFRAAWAAIKEHPGFAVHDSLAHLSATFELFDDAVSDFSSVLSEFHAEAHFGRLLNRERRSRQAQLERELRKALFMSALTAMTLVEQTRAISRSIVVDGYNDRVSEQFSSHPSHRFIQALRNQLAHVRLLRPRWQLLISNTGQRQTRFLLQPEDFSSTDEWHEIARSYLASHPEGVDLESLLSGYRERVRNFHEWFVACVTAKMGDQIAEYLGYERYLNALASRTWWNLIVQQVLIEGRRDPYQYLDRYLTKDELAEVRQLPERSKEQVDRIIEIIDEYGSVDEDLRAKVYRAFGVS